MKKIKWELEEAVVIVDLYFHFESGVITDLDAELIKLSQTLNRRADNLGIIHDENFAISMV